ncbi:hypothetical protein DH2020_012973 [Rehmannia glutinosa]|uniref:Uncharacterized protein n=1 Tax=Rehmannia glutinosa TaxID=99300 RepID=A0ABR0X4C6_REHGL
MAVTVGNCVLATVVPRRSKTANPRELGYWPTRRSVALHMIKRSRLIRIKSSLISSNDYSLEHEYKDLMKSDDDGGPPRWLTPLESENRLTASPVLLFLPEPSKSHATKKKKNPTDEMLTLELGLQIKNSDMVQREEAVKKSRELLFIEVGKGSKAMNEFADSVSNKMLTDLRKLLGFSRKVKNDGFSFSFFSSLIFSFGVSGFVLVGLVNWWLEAWN